jgi:exodeoxyribonuclease VII large subunit
MSDAPRLNIVEVTVSELSATLKRTLEDAYGYVRVRGELGKVSYHSNGHVYFDLKDDRACIAGVVWRSAAQRIKLKLEAGLEVVATGRITTYPSRSQYQIIVETLEPAGVGALMALVEERKRKLAAEGLFDEARKQLLPFLPHVIGVVTSPTGAVIRDILHRLADRFPRHVLLWPVRVQGEGSAAEVAAAIAGFNALPPRGPIPRPDLIIVARGGGSLEDLWSFNEEIVVRAAAESMIPLISAVGHETDVTLIDFAADRRAPTPTAAAEMAVPVRAELLLRVDSLTRRSLACWQRGHEARGTELRAAVRALSTAEELLAIPRQRLDIAADRLPRALRTNAHVHERLYARWAGRLRPETLRMRVGIEKTRLGSAADRLVVAVRTHIETHRTQIARRRERSEVLFARATRAISTLVHRRADVLERTGQLLDAFSYRGVLERGFALVREPGGKPLRSAESVKRGQHIDVEFYDGRVRAVSEGAAPSKPRRRGGGEGQGSLFGS